MLLAAQQNSFARWLLATILLTLWSLTVTRREVGR